MTKVSLSQKPPHEVVSYEGPGLHVEEAQVDSPGHDDGVTLPHVGDPIQEAGAQPGQEYPDRGEYFTRWMIIDRKGVLAKYLHLVPDEMFLRAENLWVGDGEKTNPGRVRAYHKEVHTRQYEVQLKSPQPRGSLNKHYHECFVSESISQNTNKTQVSP